MDYLAFHYLGAQVYIGLREWMRAREMLRMVCSPFSFSLDGVCAVCGIMRWRGILCRIGSCAGKVYVLRGITRGKDGKADAVVCGNRSSARRGRAFRPYRSRLTSDSCW